MKKKIVIAAVGSRGDVEPYVALGMELKAAGYDAVVSAPLPYEGLVRSAGLKFLALNAVNPQDMMKLPEVEARFQKGGMIGALILLMKKAGPVIRDFLTETYRNMQGADAVVLSMILYGAYEAAEKMKIPCVYTLLNPAVPTKEFPTVVAPHIPAFCNRLSHRLLEWGFYICFKKELNRLRKTVWRLPPVRQCPAASYRRKGGITLLAYSSLLVPRPADWTGKERITGYWRLPEPSDYTPEPALREFLREASGKMPVYIGFGSMPVGDVRAFLSLLEEALLLADERAAVYLSYNAGTLPACTERMFFVADVPHSWLFQRVSAVVIHGGAGTCRAGLTAGRPVFVVPFMGDQTFWGEQIYKRGLGPKPVKFKKLTASRLAGALTEMASGEYEERVRRIGAKLREENGAYVAARMISHIVENQN